MSLLLCDDHAMFRESLAAALESRGHDVLGTACGGHDGVEALSRLQPDVCLFDAPSDRGSTPDLLPRLSASTTRTALILLTGADAQAVWDAVDSRMVSGAVSKNLGLAAIERVISRVLEGERVVEGWERPSPRTDALPSWCQHLTVREREVLGLIVEGASTAFMAETFGVSRNTVRTHVQNVLCKLGVHDRAAAARLAVHSGYVLAEPELAAASVS